MKLLKNFYNFFIEIGENLQDYLLLAIRLFWGGYIANFGYEKILTLTQVTKFFGKINIPFPDFNATLVAYVECIGGIFIVLGLLSRIVPIPLIIIMIVAFFMDPTHPLKDILSNPLSIMKEDPIPFLLAFMVIWAFGPGRFSLDYFFGSRMK